MRLFGPTMPALAYQLSWKPEEKGMTLKKFSNPAWSAQFTYEVPEPEKLVLKGKFDGKKIEATLKKAPDKQYQLMTRGFHWIQEQPYN